MSPNQNKIAIGKDVLRLVTLAMYDDPLATYREYVQNAVDAFDDIASKPSLDSRKEIRISFDVNERAIKIQDTGMGIPASKFETCMRAIGRSEKKQTNLRGLWGIGRLAGLAYCQELVFSTKSANESVMSKIKWDGSKFREILLTPDYDCDLAKTIEDITEISNEPCEKDDASFFEVQLKGVVRHGNDILFNENAVEQYLSQVAPVPFHPDAPFREDIEKHLSKHVDVSGFKIFLNDNPDPIHRPHQKDFSISPKEKTQFLKFEDFEVGNRDGAPLVVGWMLHHDYLGSLKHEAAIRGLRVRSGNMQIGDERVLSDIFPEERFNSWMVGEVHIIDKNIKPNGKRDGFENTGAFRDLKTKLVPLVGRPVAKLCRTNSAARNAVRRVQDQLADMGSSLDIISIGLLSHKEAEKIITDIEEQILLLTDSNKITPDEEKAIKDKIKKTERQQSSHSAKIPKGKKELINNIADIIYDKTSSSKTAEVLIGEIRDYLNK